MTSSSKINLELFTPIIDPEQSFEVLRANLNGPTNSNMTKFDDYANTLNLLMDATLVATSASLVPINTFVANATGSMASSISASAQISASFLKLAEFSGSGQADFTSLNQNFKHLLIFGSAMIDASGSSYNLGCDFNGDSGLSNYATINWIRSGSTVSGSPASSGSANLMSSKTGSQIILACIPSYDDNIYYPASFMSFIPNYSGSSSGSYLYKNAMGISVFTALSPLPALEIYNYFAMGYQGGYYKSSSPITRIRIFASNDSGSRINLIGTKISVYGLI